MPQSARLSAGRGGAKAIRAMPKCPQHEFEWCFPDEDDENDDEDENENERLSSDNSQRCNACGVVPGLKMFFG